MADLDLILTQDDRYIRNLTPDELTSLPGVVRIQLRDAALRIKERLVRELRREFNSDISPRQRNPEYEGGRQEQLIQRMEAAYANSRVEEDGDSLDILVFDLLHMDIATRDEGQWTQNQGWFLKRIRDTDMARTGQSYRFGFISLEKAISLAERASANNSEAERSEFLNEVRIDFAGRHNEGIMVRLDSPLFFARPNFGTAEEHGVQPHPGYQKWTALKDLDGPDNAKKAAQSGGKHWILDMIEKAVNTGMRG